MTAQKPARKPTLAELNAKIEAAANVMRHVAMLPVSGYRVRVLAERVEALRDIQEQRDTLYPHWAGTLDDQMAPSWEYTPA